jgi:putative membrane protein
MEVGPTDNTHHSKLPFFIQMHGSVMPHMILPMLFVAAWTTCIWYSNYRGNKERTYDYSLHRIAICSLLIAVKFNPLLLTVTGFLVGLTLSFRNTTAYERYAEGRKYWAQLGVTSQSLARIIWTHVKEREGPNNKEDLLAKMYSDLLFFRNLAD